MQINIKQMILEGYSFDEITEAVHVNHNHLNKKILKDPKTSYVEGKKIEQNRKALADSLKEGRHTRDEYRKKAAASGGSDPIYTTQEANHIDNLTRSVSQSGGIKNYRLPKELKYVNDQKADEISRTVPRVISSAKK